MRARRIIEGASFGPDVLKVVRTAFDEAWAAVVDNFASSEHEPAREALALARMSATRMTRMMSKGCARRASARCT